MQYHSDSDIFWIFPQVNPSAFALRATPGQEGWRLFCNDSVDPALRGCFRRSAAKVKSLDIGELLL